MTAKCAKKERVTLQQLHGNDLSISTCGTAERSIFKPKCVTSHDRLEKQLLSHYTAERKR